MSNGYDPFYNSNAYISPYEDTFAHYAHTSNPQMPLSPRSSFAIASASHEDHGFDYQEKPHFLIRQNMTIFL